MHTTKNLSNSKNKNNNNERTFDMHCYICDFSETTPSILHESLIDQHIPKKLIPIENNKHICTHCYEESMENLVSLQTESMKETE